MPIDIIMPQLGESVAEGTVGRWLKQPGDPVKRDEPVVEVITDKVTAEIPAPAEGTLSEILVKEGETIPVGTPIARLEGTPVTGGNGSQRPPAPAPPPGRQQSEGEPRRISPLVRRLAEEHGLDVSEIAGTGMGGRVTREDVLRHLEARAQPAAAPAAPAAPPAGTGAEEMVPISPIRRAIAERMARSVLEAPHAWTMVEVDVSGLVALRNAARAEFQRQEGLALTYLPFFIKAVVEALKAHPLLNASWREGGIVLKHQVNVGMAVDTEQGLLVPVIHNADRLSVAALAREAATLAEKARAGKLTLPEVQGGTFTINNPGSFGSIVSMPILVPGQAGIITMEAIQRRPVAIGDAIGLRWMMNVALSFDHRVIDGGQAGRFLATVKTRLEGMGPATPIY